MPAPGQLLVQLKPGEPGRRPLFLIQPAGGTVFTYRALAEGLPRELPVYGIRASGLSAGEPVLTDIATIAACCLAQMRSVQPCGPYRLGGHSAGGVIAYEVAQQCRAAGAEVELVMLLDAPAPSAESGVRVEGVIDLMRQLAEGEAAPEQLRLVSAMEADPLLRQVVYSMTRAVLGYQPTPTTAPVLFVRALRRASTVPDGAGFWLGLSSDSFVCRAVPGDHFSMMAAPEVARLIEIVAGQLPLQDLIQDPIQDPIPDKTPSGSCSGVKMRTFVAPSRRHEGIISAGPPFTAGSSATTGNTSTDQGIAADAAVALRM